MAKSVEKPPKFQPIKDNYERFMDVLKRNKNKRLPAVDETIRERVDKYKDKEFLKKEIEDEDKYRQEYIEEGDQLPETDINPRARVAEKPRKEGVERMQRRMRESLGEKDDTPTITITKKAKVEEPKERYIAGFEKSGKPSRIRVGGNKPKSTPEQIESRKRMLRMNVGRR
jgi:hypothetical protein